MPLNTPRFNPNTAPSAPNVSNTPGGVESRSESFRKSVAAAAQVRATVNTVINTREDLVQMLRNNGLDLRTKMALYRETNDFVAASVVLYPAHKNQSEPLAQFIERYPEIKPFVLKINEDLKAS